MLGIWNLKYSDKKIMLLVISFLFSVFMFNSCSKKDSNPVNNDDENPGDDNNYFPSADGNYYKYNVTKTNENNAQTSGTRSSTFMGTAVLDHATYQVQVDTTILGDSVTINNTYFRKSESSSIYYFLDTTGFAANLDPQYRQYLPYVDFDSDMLLIFPPLQIGKDWTVFLTNINFIGTVINVQALFQDYETITVNGNSKESAKIRYTFTLSLPGSDPENYEVTAWYSADIGIVKWQGNTFLLNVLSGNGIDFADTSSTMNQILVDYNIN